MKTLILLMLLQHAVISAKAGMVTLSRGWVNLDTSGHIGEGNPLTTGSDSKVEILLRPDAYLRMLDDSEIVLECEDLYQLAVRLTKGDAIIDVTRIDKKMPIRVRVGNLETQIRKKGVYLLQSAGVSVLNGELRLGPVVKIKKGWMVSGSSTDFRKVKFDKAETHPLVEWNARRSKELNERTSSNTRLRKPTIYPGTTRLIPFQR